MSTVEKVCYYEVLGLPQDCSPEEIRSAYKKLALLRHPDKLIKSGLSSEEATASFQELVHAYEVLSDPKERKWYDSHRSQILFSDFNSSDSVGIPNLFAYFSTSCYTDYTDSKKGFYKVYGEVFDKVYKTEVNYARRIGMGVGEVKEAPIMGDLTSPYSQVNAFYGYWLGFSTVMEFAWEDKWDTGAGPDRKTRRLMEEDNKKLRKKARREYNEKVRGLAEFVKKRDKRVIDMMVKKEKEREKKREEELARKKELEREKMERARRYVEPDWAKVEEEVEFEDKDEVVEEEKEWYCVACGKKFKSEKQWKNHEQSKKHKEKVAELKASFKDEDEDIFEEVLTDEVEVEEDEEVNVDNGAFKPLSDNEVTELEEEFRDTVCNEEEHNREKSASEHEGGGTDGEIMNAHEEEKSIDSDDESSILEAMLSSRKNKKQARWGSHPKVDGSDDEELAFTEYNNVKGKKGRRARGKTKHVSGQATRASNGNLNALDEEVNVQVDPQVATDRIDEEANDERQSKIKAKGGKKNTGEEMKNLSKEKTKHVYGDTIRAGNGKSNAPDEEVNVQVDPQVDTDRMDEEANDERQYKVKSKGGKKNAGEEIKNSSKGRKQKAKQKHLDFECEKCGKEFASRNQLHKHLKETGHASLNLR